MKYHQIESKSISNEPKGCKSFLRFPGRFFFVFIFIFLTNAGYAAYTVYDRWLDSRTTISHVLLVIFTGNLMIYLFYYTMRTWYASCFGNKKMLKDEILRQNEGILIDFLILFHRINNKLPNVHQEQVQMTHFTMIIMHSDESSF